MSVLFLHPPIAVLVEIQRADIVQFLHPPIAQLVEQVPFKHLVPGSSPGGRTNFRQKNGGGFYIPKINFSIATSISTRPRRAL